MQMQMLSIGDTIGHIPKHQQFGILKHAWKSKMSLGIYHGQVMVPLSSSNYSNPQATLERN
jgi:hypothetical protein